MIGAKERTDTEGKNSFWMDRHIVRTRLLRMIRPTHCNCPPKQDRSHNSVLENAVVQKPIGLAMVYMNLDTKKRTRFRRRQYRCRRGEARISHEALGLSTKSAATNEKAKIRFFGKKMATKSFCVDNGKRRIAYKGY